MRKETIILLLILIISFTIILYSADNYKEEIPQAIRVEQIKNWDVDSTNCTENQTIITAQVEISETEILFFNLIKLAEPFESNVYYDDWHIGKISLNKPDSPNNLLTQNNQKKQIKLTEKNPTNVQFYLTIDNAGLLEAICEHIKNNETTNGNITFQVYLTIETTNQIINKFIRTISKNISFNIPIETDILSMFDTFSYELKIEQEPSILNILDMIFYERKIQQEKLGSSIFYDIIHQLTINKEKNTCDYLAINHNISFHKSKNTTMIYVDILSSTYIQLLHKRQYQSSKRTEIADINFGEHLEWETSSNEKNICASKKIIVNYYHPCICKYLINNLLEKHDLNIMAGWSDYKNISIGTLKFKNLPNKNIGRYRATRQSTYDALIELKTEEFGKLLYNHFKSNEKTDMYIKNLSEPIVFDKKISEIFPSITPKDNEINLSEIHSFFDQVKYISSGAIIGLILLFIYDFLWIKIFIKKQK